jgi:hypothetical protein
MVGGRMAVAAQAVAGTVCEKFLQTAKGGSLAAAKTGGKKIKDRIWKTCPQISLPF